MKRIYQLLISLLALSASAVSYAAWDQKCVDTCISTHHECHYCDYQCRVEDKVKTEYETGDSYRCPLQGYS